MPNFEFGMISQLLDQYNFTGMSQVRKVTESGKSQFQKKKKKVGRESQERIGKMAAKSVILF